MIVEEGMDKAPGALWTQLRRARELKPEACELVLTLTKEGKGVAVAAFTVLWNEVLFLVDIATTGEVPRAEALSALLRRAIQWAWPFPRVMYVGFLSSDLADWCCLRNVTRGIWPCPEKEGKDPPMLMTFSAGLGRLLDAKTVPRSNWIFITSVEIGRPGQNGSPPDGERFPFVRWWESASKRPVFCIGKIL